MGSLPPRVDSARPASLVRPSPFSRQPAELSALTEDEGVLSVRGGGFVTRQLMDDLLARARVRPPRSVLVDVRDIAGYEHACRPAARELVAHAAAMGIDRIALVASSTVMRTAAHVLASGAPIPLRAFEDPAQARRWLDREPSRA